MYICVYLPNFFKFIFINFSPTILITWVTKRGKCVTYCHEFLIHINSSFCGVSRTLFPSHSYFVYSVSLDNEPKIIIFGFYIKKLQNILNKINNCKTKHCDALKELLSQLEHKQLNWLQSPFCDPDICFAWYMGVHHYEQTKTPVVNNLGPQTEGSQVQPKHNTIYQSLIIRAQLLDVFPIQLLG